MDHCSSQNSKVDYFLFIQRKRSKAGIDTVPLETGKYERILRAGSNVISE
jgi:hypothetical protein